jgi:hypothetical protein
MTFNIVMTVVAVAAAAMLATSGIWSVVKLLGRVSRWGKRVERFFDAED